MPLDEFLALNPGFNRPAVTTPGQTFIVPADRASRFEARLAETLRSGQGWRTHTVEAGERLEGIAEQYGLTLAQLRQLNGLGAQGQVGSGHALLVPDGVDPSSALEASRLLPFAGAASRQQGLKLSTGGTAPASASPGREAQLRFNTAKASPLGFANKTESARPGKAGTGKPESTRGSKRAKADARASTGRQTAGRAAERKAVPDKASGKLRTGKAAASKSTAREAAPARNKPAQGRGKTAPLAGMHKASKPAR
jgi:membrane-bound lytic murein transglycosylase D